MTKRIATAAVLALLLPLPAAAQERTPAPRPKAPAEAAPVEVAEEPAQRKTFDAAMKAGQRELKRKRWAKAADQFRKALGAWPEHPEARYRLAVSLARAQKTEDARGEIQRLARTRHADVIVWQVEARFEEAFQPLLTDAEFRAALGLDRKGKAATAYERLVGFGGTWEQPGTSCTKPSVNLELARLERTFKLVIDNSCRGQSDKTRLRGKWAALGNEGLQLLFPNPGGPEEQLVCGISACSDRASEDCVRCEVDEDLSFELREVRR